MTGFQRHWLLRSGERNEHLEDYVASLTQRILTGGTNDDAAPGHSERTDNSNWMARPEALRRAWDSSTNSLNSTTPFDDSGRATRANDSGQAATSTTALAEVIGALAVRPTAQWLAAQRGDLLWLRHARDRATSRALVRKLALQSAASFWLVPPAARAAIRRILVPVDFSERSAVALTAAVELARRFDVRQCLTLHVDFPDSRLLDPPWNEPWKNKQQQTWESFVATVDIRGVDVVPLFRTSLNAARHIHEVAGSYEADLVVMATRGRTHAAERLLPSVTARFARDSRVPLLVLKPTDTPLTARTAFCEKLFTPRGQTVFE